VTDDDDLHASDDAATDLTPEERVGLIPTWIVTRDDLNRAERANIAKGGWAGPCSAGARAISFISATRGRSMWRR